MRDKQKHPQSVTPRETVPRTSMSTQPVPGTAQNGRFLVLWMQVTSSLSTGSRRNMHGNECKSSSRASGCQSFHELVLIHIHVYVRGQNVSQAVPKSTVPKAAHMIHHKGLTALICHPIEHER